MLGGGGEAGPHVAAQGLGQVGLGEVHLDGAALADVGARHDGSSVGGQGGDLELGAGGAHDGAVGHVDPAAWSSSSGSDATSTPPVARPASRRVLSELPQVVATIVWPSCSSRLRNASARAVALAIDAGQRLLGRGARVEGVEHEGEQHLGVAGAVDPDGPLLAHLAAHRLADRAAEARARSR